MLTHHPMCEARSADKLMIRTGTMSILILFLSFVLLSHGQAVDSKSDVRIKIGTVIPTELLQAETGQAMKDVLAAYISEINLTGGINGKKVDLLVPVNGTSGEKLRYLVSNGVFAIVGGFAAGLDAEAISVTKETGVPWIGPSTLLTSNDPSLNPSIYYIIPGIAQQSMAAVAFLARSEPKVKTAHIVFADGVLHIEAARAIDQHAKTLGWKPITRTQVGANCDARAIASQLKDAGVDTVFLLAAECQSSFLSASQEIGWAPKVAIVGILSSRNLQSSVPVSFAGSVWIVLPTVPSDVKPTGNAELRTLAEKYGFRLSSVVAQISALAAAKVFIEAARSTSPELTPDRFRKALEQIRDLDIGLTPKVTFGPQRRIGSLGSYVVEFNPRTKEYVNATWISLE